MTQPPSNAPSTLLPTDLKSLRPVLHRYCARMVGSVLDGEEIVQEAFVRALEAAPPDRPMENPQGWLFRIAHNLALDFLRRRARQGDAHSEEDMEQMADPVDELARREANGAALPAFMHLPASQRGVVILFDVLEYSAEDIGGMLEISVPAVKSLLQRGRSRLREISAWPQERVHPATLSATQEQLLRTYVALFNARDFDAIRATLATDVQLDLVNRLQLRGPAVGEYYARYGQATDWHASPGIVEGHPAVLIRKRESAGMRPDYFVVLEWTDGKLTAIRDFLFANYATHDAELSPL